MFFENLEKYILRQSKKKHLLKRQPHKTVKHTQTICRLTADETFGCVWQFCGVGG